jgi:hypothetical protein
MDTRWSICQRLGEIRDEVRRNKLDMTLGSSELYQTLDHLRIPCVKCVNIDQATQLEKKNLLIGKEDGIMYVIHKVLIACLIDHSNLARLRKRLGARAR